MSDQFSDPLRYAFGHLVASHFPDDPHHGDSGALGSDVLAELGLSAREALIVETLAEEVAGNYRYTGEADEIHRRILSGEL